MRRKSKIEWEEAKKRDEARVPDGEGAQTRKTS